MDEPKQLRERAKQWRDIATSQKQGANDAMVEAACELERQAWAVFGTMGGDAQPQIQAQVLINLVDHGLEPQEALARPRLRARPGGRLDIEADYPGAAELARKDGNVLLMPPRHHEFGHAHAIVIDGPGSWRAGADPRSDGSVETAG